MATQLKVIQPKRALPCSTCKSECCGSFPLGNVEYTRIIDYLRTLPKETVIELSKMRRAPYQCNFLDTEHWRCAVYPKRPTACRVYGMNPIMTCSHLPESTGELGDAEFIAELTFNSMMQEYRCNSGEMTGWQMTAVKTYLDTILSGQDREYDIEALKAMIQARQPFEHRGLTWAQILKELGYDTPTVG